MPKRTRSFALLWLLSSLACSTSGEPSFPTPDGKSVPLPLECRVETTAAVPHRVAFTWRNEGARPVFFAVAYTCGVTASISSCATAFKDELLLGGAGSCPCTGSCPVGGPGCSPGGKELAPGAATDRLSWQATIAVVGTKNGEACVAGTRDLPAGRYRINAPVFASAEDATAGAPVLATISKEFELPSASEVVEVGFSVP